MLVFDPLVGYGIMTLCGTLRIWCLALAIAFMGAAAGCGGSGESTDPSRTAILTTSPAGPPSDPSPGDASPDDTPAPAVEQDCSDFTAWRDAQDALDSDSDLESLLDDDLDGVACNELGQEEYEGGFQQGSEDACSFVWQESPDGLLYYDDTGYEQSDCDTAAPLPDEWESSPTGDPESEGETNGWNGACEDLFAYVGFGALFWGDTIVVSQSDCEGASP